MKKILFVFAIVSIFAVISYAFNSNIIENTAPDTEQNIISQNDVTPAPTDSIKAPCDKTVSTKDCCAQKIANGEKPCCANTKPCDATNTKPCDAANTKPCDAAKTKPCCSKKKQFSVDSYLKTVF